MPWKNRPKFIRRVPANICNVLYIDENGIPNLGDIIANRNIYSDKKDVLTITGISIRSMDMPAIRNSFLSLKKRHWENGEFCYKGSVREVCFHSREIRKQESPFSPDIIDCHKFIVDLTEAMKEIPITIFSSSIDKVSHAEHYVYPAHPYNLSLNFIIERYAKYFLGNNESAIIILEARTPRQDKFTLQHIKRLLSSGSPYINPKRLSKIKGVYFNRKWIKNSGKYESCTGLEIADLCSYPIHKYVKYSNRDLAFKSIEDKIYHYPDYHGYGLKIFP